MSAPAKGWIDVSVPIRDGMIHWPGDPPVKVELAESIAKGDPANVTHLDLGAHTGTHVDAPRHFVEEGADIDSMPLAAGIGCARVVEIFDPEKVGEEELGRHQPRQGERLILKTRNSERRWADEPFDEGFVHLAPGAARLIADRGVRTVGVDYLSVGGLEDGEETHRALLSAGVWLIEGLDLAAVEPGDYELLCLPIRLAGAEGAPARAYLRAQRSGADPT